MKPSSFTRSSLTRSSLAAATLLVSLGALAPAQAQMTSSDPQEWKLKLTMGAERGTEKFFKGVLVHSRTDPWFGVDLSRGRWLLSSINGLTYVLQDSETMSLGLGANYLLGRNASHEPRYKGLGDVEATLGGYAFFEWRPVKDAVTVYGNALKSSKSANGTLANLGATVAFPVYGQLSGFADFTFSWGDANYNKTYFGVNTTQAATSGYAPFATKSGIVNTTPTAGLYYPINKQWAVLGYVGKTRLGGSAGDSTIVQNRSQSVGALLAVYKY
jgi:outer membrane scaffolding protein for murein synthesis (MipA/OmpV family)